MAAQAAEESGKLRLAEAKAEETATYSETWWHSKAKKVQHTYTEDSLLIRPGTAPSMHPPSPSFLIRHTIRNERNYK